MKNFNFIKPKGSTTLVLAPQSEIEATYEKLIPAIYDVNNIGGMFKKTLAFSPKEKKDGLVDFKSGVFNDVIQKCVNFFDSKTQELYKELSIFQKMGLLLYGPPGTGKTCLAQLVMYELISKYEVLCFDFTNINPGFIIDTIKDVRAIQNNPIVVFIDEIDHSILRWENGFLTFMDGSESFENVIILGCTNFYEKIPKRFTERKSRIKHSFEIKSLPESIYKDYILGKLPNIQNNDLQAFVYHSVESSLTIDECKHSLINWHIENMTIEDSINEAKSYVQDKVNDEEESN